MKLLNVKQVAAALSCSESWVWQLKKTDPTFPKSVSIGSGKESQRATRWIEEDLAAWVQTRRKGEPSSDQPVSAAE